MSDTPLSPGLISRVTQAARYVISGVKPDAWFGPLQPMAPIAPPDVAGRRFDYPTGYNLNYTPRSYEPVSFEDLRALADNCDILRSVIETRKDQVEAQEWTVRVAQNDSTARVPQASDDQKRRIDAVLAFLHSPDKQHGFDQWLRQILEDMFVIDGVAIYKRRNQAGGLYALEVLDGATIKLLLDDSGRAPLPPDPAYQQILKGVPAADYTREEMMYLVHNPRSHKVYGYSHVEQVLMTVNILIRRSAHQLEYYREGSVPDALIGTPKEWTVEQIESFQKNFDAMLSGNLGMRRRARFMPGDFKYQETKAPPLKDAYDEFLSRVICFVFSISPEPFVGQVNRATAESSQSRAIDEGLAPLMRFVRNLLNRIIACEFASPDLEFAWTETRAQDPSEAAQIDVAYVGAGILTVDEVRANMGLAPVAGGQNPTPMPGGVNNGGFKSRNAAALKKNLRKDDDDEDDDSGDDDSDDDGSNSDDADDDGSDFDDKHPRWAAGSPGGIGGEFAPKDAGDATGALHNAISEDTANNARSSDGTVTQEGPEMPMAYAGIEADPDSSWFDRNRSWLLPAAMFVMAAVTPGVGEAEGAALLEEGLSTGGSATVEGTAATVPAGGAGATTATVGTGVAADAFISSSADNTGNVSAGAEKALGTDPDSLQFRQTEADTAQLLQSQVGPLQRSPDNAYDWIDAQGLTYDAVGPVSPQYFNAASFNNAIDNHLLTQGLDRVPVNIVGLTAQQQAVVETHISGLSAQNQARIILLK